MADAIVMDRNIKALFGVGMISAFILGVYEILFPFYLASRGLSLVGMGLIFSVSTLIVAFFRIFVGEYTDVYGRKKAYMTSSVLSTVSKILFPFSIDVFAITFNKFLDDLQENIRVSVHNVMLYENTRKAFAKFFSWFTASNFVLQASGNLILAGLLLYFGYSGCFFLLAGIEVIKFATVLVYREDKVEQKIRKISLKEAFSFKVDKRLKILSVSAAIGTLGFGVAHGFLLPLYFAGKYGLDFFQISLVTAVHRLSFLTTPFAGKIIRKIGARTTWILTTTAYVVSFLAIGLITFPIIIFVGVFLVHDLVGGGIRMTATNVLVQGLAAEDRRGREVNAFEAVQMPVIILAPGLAGTLAALSWDFTFLAGGLLFLVSLCIFILFFKEVTGK